MTSAIMNVQYIQLASEERNIMVFLGARVQGLE